MSKDTFNVGIIGVGKVAKQMHLPALKAIGANVIGVADTNVESARKIAKRFGIPNFFASYKDLLELDLDIVHICTPAYLHPSMIIDCAKHGKHILVEKPLGLSSDDIKVAIKEVKKRKVKAGVVQNFRYYKTIEDMKKFYDMYIHKNLITIKTTWHTTPPIASSWLLDEDKSGGLLFEVGVHDIDLQLYFANKKVKSVVAIPRYFYNVDFITDIKIVIEFEDETLGLSDLSYIGSDSFHEIEVFGTVFNMFSNFREYRIEFGGEVIKIPSDPSKIKNWALRKIRINEFENLHAHLKIITQFVECLRNDAPPLVSLEEGLNTIKVLESIKESMTSGKKVVL